MQIYQGVAITDGLNRKNHFMPLETLIDAYRESWNTVIPVNLGHDRTKPIGYTKITGIYMEPGKAYATNEVAFTETEDEYDAMRKYINARDYQIFCEAHKDEIELLRNRLGNNLSESFSVAPIGQAVALKDTGIVSRLFPEWVKTFSDGLVDARELEPVYSKNENGEKGFIIPGVFIKEGYLVFAHQYFRRTLSLANTTNDEFFNSFEKIRIMDGVKVKLALDMDMVGLPGTEHPEFEYQYIRGPHFNDDLNGIPEGVTCHDNEHYDNLFSNLLSTQFYWHMQDGKRTFECEELCDKENISFDGENTLLWGCRYVHSMLNPITGLPNHLDGAIRIYNDEQILERIDSKTDISKCGKDSEYVKLWRIDNDFSVELWKELISAFYRENALIGEYFGGVDEKFEQIKKESAQRNSIADKPNKFIPVNLSTGDGLRLFYQCTSQMIISAEYDVRIVNKDEFICKDNKRVKILEADSITFFKLIARKGIRIRMPYSTLIEFGDTVTNFPTICCKNLDTVYMVLEAVHELCQAWNLDGDDRLLAVGIMLNEENQAVQFSLAGHVSDFSVVLKNVVSDRMNSFDEIIKKIYVENNVFGKAGDNPNKFTLIHGDVVCFDRYIVPPRYITDTHWEGKDEIVNLSIPEDEAKYLEENKIICAPIKWVKNSRCSKCGNEYVMCSCVKFIDKDVVEIHSDYEQIGMTWTNRSAYFPDGVLSFHKNP